MRMNNRRKYDWTIMSASAWISGKPSIEKIIKENQSKSTIMVVERDNKLIFVLGAIGNYGEVGENKSYIKDTGSGYGKDGNCHIQNLITVNETGITNPGNGIGINEKRTLYVFK